MSEDSADQIHPATPARREMARRDGDFAKSFELAASLQMLGIIVVAWLLFDPLATWLKQATTEAWSPQLSSQSITQISRHEFNDQIRRWIFSSFTVLAPIGALLLGFGIFAHWCQTGPLFLSGKLTPDLHRLAPTNWFQRLFSIDTLAFPLIGLPKSVVALGAMFASGWFNRSSFLELGTKPIDEMVTGMFQLVLTVSLQVAVVLVIASVLDYGLKQFSFQHRIRMTEQQLRDEARTQTRR
jgi:flagellar biosynthesis protein FlhB